MKVEMWQIDRPVPYARNPRKNDGAVDKVAASIKDPSRFTRRPSVQPDHKLTTPAF